jgi:hypothetical protein
MATQLHNVYVCIPLTRIKCETQHNIPQPMMVPLCAHIGENALLCKLQLLRSLDSKYADLKACGTRSLVLHWFPFLQWICPICGPQTRIKTGVA